MLDFYPNLSALFSWQAQCLITFDKESLWELAIFGFVKILSEIFCTFFGGATCSQLAGLVLNHSWQRVPVGICNFLIFQNFVWNFLDIFWWSSSQLAGPVLNHSWQRVPVGICKSNSKQLTGHQLNILQTGYQPLLQQTPNKQGCNIHDKYVGL